MTISSGNLILIDTNVLVYAYDSSDTRKQRQAQTVLDVLQPRDGALSVQVLGEVFWTLTRKLQPRIAPERAGATILTLTRAWTVFAVTPETVTEAVRGSRRFQLPYWDALIWATARLNGARHVLSEDFANGTELDGVRIANPFAELFDLAAVRGSM